MKNKLSQDQDYSLFWLIGQAKDTLYLARSRELRGFGVTLSQTSVLLTIKKLEDVEGKATLGKMSEWLLNEPHTVSRIVSRMEKAGFLKKVKGSGSTNELNIKLTEKGEQAYKQSLTRESIRDIMSSLSEEERSCLYTALAKLRDKAIEKIGEKNVPFP